MERNRSQFIFERKHRTDNIFKRRTFPLQSPALWRAKKSILTQKKRRLLPLVSIVPVIVLSLVLGNVGGTASYYRDVENSTANVLQANAFDFNLSVTPNEYTIDVTAIDPVGPIMPLAVPVPGSTDGQYRVTVEKNIGGSDAFCAALFVDATSIAPAFSYNNPLLSLTTDQGTITAPLSMLVSVSGDVSGIVDGDMCTVDLVYTGFENTGPEQK